MNEMAPGASRQLPRFVVALIALVAVAAAMSFATRDTERTVPIPLVEIQAAPSMLVVFLDCYDGGEELELVSETDESITFRLTVVGDPCETLADVVEPVELSSPLGDRQILDEHTGAPIPRRD